MNPQINTLSLIFFQIPHNKKILPKTIILCIIIYFHKIPDLALKIINRYLDLLIMAMIYAIEKYSDIIKIWKYPISMERY
jgi:hypothetical protein